MPKILVIEDEKSILKMIAYDLKQLQYDVDTASDGLEGYKMASKSQYDVILLDIMLPSMNGMDICKRLRQDKNSAYIIMLTAMDDEYNKIEGFEAGADDYVTKPFSPRELAARIKALLRRQGKEVETALLEYKNISMNLASFEVRVDNLQIDLTLKEFELLEYLIKNKGKALSRDQLLNTLWGYSYDGDTRVVDVHIFKLREKIADGQSLIQTVRGVGYKMV
jgi:two-component system, OmpR family, alkaline phosphatase synthesis response regulator PhoP